MSEPEVCKKCGKPVLDGEAVNGLTRNHWDCDPRQTPAEISAEFVAAAKRVDAALDKVRAKLRKM